MTVVAVEESGSVAKAAPRKRPRVWRAYFLGVLTPPLIYLGLYAALRFSGVYTVYYAQGSWGIDGTAGKFWVDVIFAPATILEGRVHDFMRWIPIPDNASGAEDQGESQ